MNSYVKYGLQLILPLLVLMGCAGENEKKKALEMVTARTMGLAYLEEDKIEEAESAFKKLISLAPNEALGYANLGLVYIRKGAYNEAQAELEKALEIEPYDPEIQLNLAEIFLLTNRESDAIHLLNETLRYHPNHIRTLYKLGQILSKTRDDDTLAQAKQLLLQVVEFIPGNVAARMELVDVLIRREETVLADQYLSVLRSQLPEFPAQADNFYQTCRQMLQQSQPEKAYSAYNLFRNILKPTPLYRAGFDELKGIGGPLIGTPIITFRKEITSPGPTEEVIFDAIRFTDVTESAGLGIIPQLKADNINDIHPAYIFTLADFDGNSTQDLYVSGYNHSKKKYYRFLFENNFGKFTDITASSGIIHNGTDKHALFTDYNNDGFLDLFIVNDNANALYYHYEPKKFRDVAAQTGIGGDGTGAFAAFADFDHDGDLDLFQSTVERNQFYRNNLDGTFTEQAEKMDLTGQPTVSTNVLFADFDDDGDLDLFVLNPQTSHQMFSNLRQGQFADVTRDLGLITETPVIAAASGDYNNDGLIDLFFTFSGGGARLYANRDRQPFERDDSSPSIHKRMSTFECSDVHFFDFDNDGFLDLIAGGEEQGSSGLILFRNDGLGLFEDVSFLLPPSLPSIKKIELADYNEDGDLDIFCSTADGKIILLRNDGGNANKYLKVQLVGLRTGSGKNNYFGIGAKIEVKARDLYQSHYVTEPVSHFGLGQNDQADVVRVIWTNGVPQNIFKPGSDQALLEKQILKGSCPFLYAWNGQKYEFVTDVLWRSALGMPLGIMGGETTYGFSDPSYDYFRVPGEMLSEQDGVYRLQLTCELWETAYVDQVKLFTVDHPDSVDIYVDERFTPPPYPPFKLYIADQKHSPVSAFDHWGNNVLSRIQKKDNKYIDRFEMTRYQGITTPQDLTLDLGEFNETQSVLLYLNGWVFPTDASINKAISQSRQINSFPPRVQVLDRQGRWKTVIESISFPMGKNKHIIVNMTDKFLSDKHIVRIQTTMQIYWDHIFFTLGERNIQSNMDSLSLIGADLHYRGFSKMYRKGGTSGPFWFDYSNLTTQPIWRDLEGNYTRFGDVHQLLQEMDSKYAIMNAGDEITIEFDARSVTPVANGWSRDFLILTGGWLKDGDLNTAEGQYVDPLPFLGMSKYPYEADETYPQTEAYQNYLKQYNTRVVTSDRFRKLIKP